MASLAVSAPSRVAPRSRRHRAPVSLSFDDASPARGEAEANEFAVRLIPP